MPNGEKVSSPHIPKPSDTALMRGTKVLTAGKEEIRRLTVETVAWRLGRLADELRECAGELEELKKRGEV